MGGFTWEQLITTGYVLLAVFAAIVTVDKVLDIIQKWKAPTTNTMRELALDKQRLDEHDQEIRSLKEGQQVLCSGLLALLDHELHNGNTDQMQKARDEMMSYLQGRIVM